MEQHLVFVFIKHILNYYNVPTEQLDLNKAVCFEKGKFRSKADVSILRRILQIQKDDTTSLLAVSKTWCFPLSNANFSNDYLHLFLLRPIVFKETIKQVEKKQLTYGFHPKNKQIVLQKENDIKNSLSQLRIDLALECTKNFAQRLGYEIYNEAQWTKKMERMEDVKKETLECRKLYFTNRSKAPNNYDRVFVMCVEHEKKKSELTKNDYWTLKLSEVTSMSNDMESSSTSNENLANASVKFELLHGNLAAPVRISETDGVSHNTKDAIFVIYNYVRMKVLLKTFQSKVDDKVYPSLPDIDNVDFSLLVKEEEWDILLDHVVRFPQLVCEFSSKLNLGKVHLHAIFIMLVVFSKQLSRYYRRVRILTEPKQHLVQVMFARIHLIKACVTIYETLFQCLDIKPPSVM